MATDDNKDEEYREDLAAFVPRPAARVKVLGVSHPVPAFHDLPLAQALELLALEDETGAAPLAWRQLRMLVPAIPDEARHQVSAQVVQRVLARAWGSGRGSGTQSSAERRISIFDGLARYRRLYGDPPSELMKLSLRQVQVYTKYGEREHAASLIDLALATGWIHIGDRGVRTRLMRQWERRAQGEPPRPQLPPGIDLSKFSEKAQKVYRAFYHAR